MIGVEEAVKNEGGWRQLRRRAEGVMKENFGWRQRSKEID